MNTESYVSLIVNLGSFLMAIGAIRMSYRRENLISLLYWFVFAFLVVGQAIHISFSLIQSVGYTVYYLSNEITPIGHLLASMIVFFIAATIILFNIVSRKYIYVATRCDETDQKNIKKIKHVWIYYLLNLMFLVVTVLFLLNLVGFYEWIHLSRSFAPGSTFFLILLTLPMYPLFIKVSLRLPLNWQDKLLYVFALLFVLSFSRILAIFQLLLAIVIYFYTMIGNKGVSIKKYRTMLGYYGILLFFMFFVYGSYRHFEAFAGSADFVSFFNHVLAHPEESLFSLDINYKLGIEAMSGLSGVLTEQMNRCSTNADFGLSALGSGLLQLMPSLFRQCFGSLSQTIHSLYYYQQSIVAGGLECFFVHFSFFGFIFYPFVFYLYSSYIHRKLLLLNRSGGSVYRQRIFLSIIAVYGLQIIRGSTETLITFTLAELIVMMIAVWFFRFFYFTQKVTYEDNN